MTGATKMPRKTTLDEVLIRVEEIVQKPGPEVRRTIEVFFEILPEVLAESQQVRVRHFGDFRLSRPRKTLYGLQGRTRPMKPEILFSTSPKTKARLEVMVQELQASDKPEEPRPRKSRGDP